MKAKEENTKLISKWALNTDCGDAEDDEDDEVDDDKKLI